MINALIVDDEAKARETLSSILNKFFPEVNIVGEAHSVESAFQMVERTNPQVVFLDIKMGDGTGFDLLRRYHKIPFKVVFVTAFDSFAIEAFKFSAFDYLLKPINTKDLRRTIANLRETVEEKEDISLKIEAFMSNMENRDVSNKRIVLKTSNSIHLVNLSEALRFEADANYTWVYIQGQPQVLISKSLKYFEDMLKDFGFFRVHQSHLINLSHITRIDKVDGGVVILSDNSSIPIAVRKREMLFQMLDIL